jgi:hypothetical protein
MMKMNKEDFFYFNKVINEYILEKNTMKTYLGKDVIIKSTAVTNIHFGFTRKEFFELKELFTEAIFMNNVFDLTNPEKLKDLTQ